jgi:hypothetical protein
MTTANEIARIFAAANPDAAHLAATMEEEADTVCGCCGGEGYRERYAGYVVTGSGYGDCEQRFEIAECPSCHGTGEAEDMSRLVTSDAHLVADIAAGYLDTLGAPEPEPFAFEDYRDAMEEAEAHDLAC